MIDRNEAQKIVNDIRLIVKEIDYTLDDVTIRLTPKVQHKESYQEYVKQVIGVEDALSPTEDQKALLGELDGIMDKIVTEPDEVAKKPKTRKKK